MKPGDKVSYTFYSAQEIATIVRTSKNGEILFLDNGRWMHRQSCTKHIIEDEAIAIQDQG